MEKSTELDFLHKRIKNKYLIIEKLGRGGMGIVYKALLMPIEKEVAIKLFLLPPGMFTPDQEKELRTRFIIEGHVMAKMRHKNIMALHDFDIDDDIPFYTMDLMPNSLAKMIEEDLNFYETKPIPAEEVHSIGLQICDGLGHLHSNGVTHRDIKPGNILLTEENDVKVADFGISDIEWLDFTVYGSGFLSVYYSSPEQKKGEKASHKSDIYSVGLTLYKLLTGRFPSLDFTQVSSQVQDIDPLWDKILSKTLKENPDQRYQDVAEFKEDLLKMGKKEEESLSELVKVPAGEFCFGKEMTRKKIPEFCIDKYPVTNKEYRKFIDAQNYPEPAFFGNPKFDKDDQPVVGVSWEDTNAYARWAKKRLPTEEEWEKAARGKSGRLYPWGNERPDKDFCNYGEMIGKTTPVNKYENNRSYYGCYDMAGNVWEWTADADEEDETYKIVKGGSWLSFPLQLICSNKNRMFCEDKKSYVGFRCVKDDS